MNYNICEFIVVTALLFLDIEGIPNRVPIFIG